MPETTVLSALLTRRSIKPKHLCAPAPDEAALKLAARAARRAPVNSEHIPCRFVVVPEVRRAHLAELFEAAARNAGADEERCAKTKSKALKGPMIIGFVVDLDPEKGDVNETLISSGAALEQFLLTLDAQGFGGIMLSGSVLKDEALQKAFCSPTEKLVGWLTVGTPDETVQKIEEAREGALSVWKD